MGKKKKIMKAIESFKKCKQEHKDKIENYDGTNYALIEYWEKEIERIDEEIKRMKEKLKKK